MCNDPNCKCNEQPNLEGETIMAEENVTNVTFDALLTKFTELTDMVNALTAKVTEMGTMQENLAGKTFVAEEKDYDIGTSEAWQANMKRMYDEYQRLSLENIDKNRVAFDNVQNVALQALQNAVETANMIAKQAVAHRDIAINSEWKPKPKDRVGETS
jgi:hypothetical protein